MRNKPIALCGFMGCGKSSVGRALAKILGYKFIDSDSYIEEKYGMTIPEIFEAKGEDYFRDIEHEAIKELSLDTNTVIATGGGVVTFERNTKILKENTFLVMIDVCLPAIQERLKFSHNRPLIEGPDKAEKVKQLYNKRLPIYKRAADYIVDGNTTPKSVANRIIDTIKPEM